MSSGVPVSDVLSSSASRAFSACEALNELKKTSFSLSRAAAADVVGDFDVLWSTAEGRSDETRGFTGVATVVRIYSIEIAFTQTNLFLTSTHLHLASAVELLRRHVRLDRVAVQVRRKCSLYQANRPPVKWSRRPGNFSLGDVLHVYRTLEAIHMLQLANLKHKI